MSFVKLDRSLLDKKLFKDKEVLPLFLHVLITAPFKDYFDEKSGRSYKRGELQTTERHLSEAVGLNRGKVRRCLKFLVDQQTIELRADFRRGGGTVIRLINYDYYQTYGEGSRLQRPTPDSNPPALQEAPKPAAKPKEKKAAHPNAWSLWIDANREVDRKDPIPAGPDTSASANLLKAIPDRDELKRIMLAYLRDTTDRYVNSKGHALHLLPGKVNTYTNPQPPAESDAVDVSGILARLQKNRTPWAKRSPEDRANSLVPALITWDRCCYDTLNKRYIDPHGPEGQRLVDFHNQHGEEAARRIMLAYLKQFVGAPETATLEGLFTFTTE